MTISREKIGLIFFGVFLVLAWTSSDHYPPWTAFHSDAIAFAALIIYICIAGVASGIRLEVLLLLALSAVPVAQYFLGIIYFKGDAIVASGYLAGFALAFHAGSHASGKNSAFIAIGVSLVVMALLSGGVAFGQWLNIGGDFISIVPVKAGRIYGNFAQPNQFATMMGVAVVISFGLRERGVMGGFSLLLFLLFSVFCVALSESRAGMLEIALMVILLGWLKVGKKLTASWGLVVAPLMALILFLYAAPSIHKLLLLSDGATRDYISAGVRLMHWENAVRAIFLKPLVGFGWNQTAVALAQTVNMGAATGELVEHSHNILLDILLWNGVPLGLVIIFSLAIWIFNSWRQANSINDEFIFSAFLMVGLHSMLEFPLEYAYVLIPMGFLLGLTSRGNDLRVALVSNRLVLSACALGLVCFGVVLRDYYYAEDRFRELRLDGAKIGPPPKLDSDRSLVLLSQLENFLQFSQVQATPGMSASDLKWMREVSERYGYPPVLFRYALAAGLNNDYKSAESALQRVCQTQNETMCEEARVNWRTMVNKYPELSDVKLPYRR